MWIRKRWRRVAAVAVVLVLVVLSVRALDSKSTIEYYRVLDDRTLSVGTVEGHNAWTRVTALDETATTITITVSSLLLQIGAGTADGVPIVTEVKLHDPIGTRAVVDGSTGLSAKQCTHEPAYPTDCF